MANDENPPAEVVDEPFNDPLSPDMADSLTDEQIMDHLRALDKKQRNAVVMLMVSMNARWWFELNVYRREPDRSTILTRDLKLHQTIYAGVVNLCHVMNNRQVSKFNETVRALGALVGVEVK